MLKLLTNLIRVFNSPIIQLGSCPIQNTRVVYSRTVLTAGERSKSARATARKPRPIVSMVGKEMAWPFAVEDRFNDDDYDDDARCAATTTTTGQRRRRTTCDWLMRRRPGRTDGWREELNIICSVLCCWLCLGTYYLIAHSPSARITTSHGQTTT